MNWTAIGSITALIIAVGSSVYVFAGHVFDPIHHQEHAFTAIPIGAVVAFDLRGCPEDGWEPFTELAGRTVLGAGAGAGLTRRQFGESGGTERLSEDHLPSHSHRIPRTDLSTHDATGGTRATGGDGGNPGFINSDSFGNSEQDVEESMTPYLVLTYCKKI